MTKQELWTRARPRLVPIIWISALVIGALVFRSQLVGWFTGESGDGSASAGVKATVGALTVEAALSPDPARQGDNAITLTLRDADGNGVDGAEVEVAAWMPAMGSMPEMRSKGKVEARGGGVYRAAFELAMGGTWNIDVSAKTSLGTVEALYTATVGSSGLVPVSATGTGGGSSVQGHPFAPAARTEMERALAGYEQVRARLAADEVDGVAAPAAAVASALRAATTADTGMPEMVAGHLAAGADAADQLGRATDLPGARAAFATLSQHLIAGASADHSLTHGLHVFECPMTKGYNKWLQPEAGISNPYMGPGMLTCGAEIEVAAAVPGGAVTAHVHDPDEIAHYTCPMDTWVKQQEPGTCPVCGMDLLPVTKEEVRTGVMRIDHRRRQLIGLKTGLVERRDLDLGIRAIGRVSYDETRQAEITLKYDGFIEKLNVEETGQAVRKGQTLLTLYSPELYSAQQEYLLALAQRDAARDETGRARAEALVRGARQRLKLWDVSDGQLAEIEKRGEPMQYVPVLAPASGYVVSKDVIEGAAVKRGQRLFRIAALDRVWIEADVYEKDIPLVKVGQTATVTLTHLPGRSFQGKVTFIYPYLEKSTRTARARIELSNKDLELKPEMYANVELRVPLGERLVVPEAAVIYSGPRRVVFLDMAEEQLRPVPIEVGVKAGGFFEVISGLDEGDRVVTSGNFLLSAESRLKAATGLW